MPQIKNLPNDLFAICFSFFAFHILLTDLNLVCQKWNTILNSYSACWKLSNRVQHDMIRFDSDPARSLLHFTDSKVLKLLNSGKMVDLQIDSVRLDLRNSNVFDRAVQMLETYFPNIECLSLIFEWQMDNFFVKLLSFQSLTCLSFSFTDPLSTDNLSAILNLSNLNYLGLSLGGKEYGSQVALLLMIPHNEEQRFLKSLRSVSLRSNYSRYIKFPGSNINFLPSIQNLEFIDFNQIVSESEILTENTSCVSFHSGIGDLGKSATKLLKSAKNLKFLNLNCAYLQSNDLNTIFANFRLEKLHFKYSSDIYFFDWSSLLKLKSTLKTFYLPQHISKSLIINLMQMTHLEFIFAKDVEIESFSFFLDAIFSFHLHLKQLKEIHGPFSKQVVLEEFEFRARIYGFSQATITNLNSWLEKHYFENAIDYHFHRNLAQ